MARTFDAKSRFWSLTEDTQDAVLEAEELLEKGKQEEVDKMKHEFKRSAEICGAVSKGKICIRKPVVNEDGSSNGRCAWHGGKSTGAKTEEGLARAKANLHPKAALIHGLYAKDLELTQEEAELYNALMQAFIDMYGDNILHLSLMDKYILNLIKQARLDKLNLLKGSKDYNSPETMILRYATELGFTPKFTQSKAHKDNKEKIDMSFLFDDE